MTALVQVVNAVRAVDSFKRKPEGLRAISFFGKYDLWRYEAHHDLKLCEECLGHAFTAYFIGTELRSTFKYLKIIDANTIEARVHPNCRCILHRERRAYVYLTVMAEEFSRFDADMNKSVIKGNVHTHNGELENEAVCRSKSET